MRKFLAWCVHGYTALGLVAAGGMAVAILDGRPASFRVAFVLMLVATLIDATDGTLARAAGVRQVLPGFDGRRLDDLIDFQTYTSLPLLLIWRAGLIPVEWQAWLLAPLLASAYGFCQSHAKTDDGYFLGFPSYWNIIAFYLYVLQPPAWLALGLILLFALLTFVPARYLYPTHRGRLNFWSNLLGVPWALSLIWVLVRLPDRVIEGRYADDTTRLIALVSVAYPLYYLGVSWAISVQIFFRARRMRRHPVGSPHTTSHSASR
jgi:phosphatidylcholine synthase